jgi:hypothetical protein
MVGKKWELFLAVAVIVCCVYLFSMRSNGPSDEPSSTSERYHPRIVIVNVQKIEGERVSYEIAGTRVTDSEIPEAVYRVAIDAGFLGPGRYGRCNCRVVVQAGDEIRWRDVAELIQCCGRCGIVDVCLANKDIVLPLRHRPYILKPFYNRWYPPPERVYLGVRWVEKSTGRETLSEDGSGSIRVYRFEKLPAIQEDGTVIIDHEEERRRIRRTDDWHTAQRWLLELSPGHRRGHVEVFISIGQMVPVPDVLNAIAACGCSGGGYEILAP